MKLEPKHILKHLPYNPKVLNGYGEISNLITEVLFHPTDFLANNYIDSILLYLHPLSDLIKPITHKGETFVPMDMLRKYLVEIDSNSFGLLYNGLVGDEVFKTHTFQYAGNSNISLLAMPYHFIEQLLEWHFDIDNLIGHGLAVDIKTLK